MGITIIVNWYCLKEEFERPAKFAMLGPVPLTYSQYWVRLWALQLEGGNNRTPRWSLNGYDLRVWNNRYFRCLMNNDTRTVAWRHWSTQIVRSTPRARHFNASGLGVRKNLEFSGFSRSEKGLKMRPSSNRLENLSSVPMKGFWKLNWTDQKKSTVQEWTLGNKKGGNRSGCDVARDKRGEDPSTAPIEVVLLQIERSHGELPQPESLPTSQRPPVTQLHSQTSHRPLTMGDGPLM